MNTADLFPDTIPALSKNDLRLPAISLWHPWASLLYVARAKAHETRGYAYGARLAGKTILIHASKTRAGVTNMDPDLEALCLARFGEGWKNALPYGAFLGKARLDGCYPTDLLGKPQLRITPEDELCGNWGPGRYAWRMRQREAFKDPIPAIGQRGWWTAVIPRDVPIARVLGD